MKERPSDWLETGCSKAFQVRLRRAAELVITVRRKMGEEDDELRDDVLADVKDALTGDGPSAELVEVAGVPGPSLCIGTEGIFRQVVEEFGLDRAAPMTQESFWEAARRMVEEALHGPRG